jgi:hypothetical protein
MIEVKHIPAETRFFDEPCAKNRSAGESKETLSIQPCEGIQTRCSRNLANSARCRARSPMLRVRLVPVNNRPRYSCDS